jgi:hypothetical protein
MYIEFSSSFHLLAPDPRPTNNNIIIPDGISVTSITLPAKVHARNLRLDGAPLPLRSIGVRHARLDRKSSNSGVIQPCLNSAVSAEMVLEASPGVGGESGGSSDSLGREVGQRGVVGFAVVHQDLGLATDAQMLLSALSRVGHGYERDV